MHLFQKCVIKRIFSQRSSTPHIKTKYEVTTLAKVRVDGVQGGCDKRIDQALKIPGDVKSSNSLYCKVVQISYLIEVKAEIAFRRSIKRMIPITIGSIPLNFSEELN